MPLSSVLGASSVIKPGVVTSSTRPAVPYEGQLIYETDTKRVAAWNGSAWIYETSADGPPGLVLIKTQTINSAVSSVTVSDAFTSTYDNYKIMISNGVGSTELQLNMTLGSSSTQYYSSGIYTDYSTGSVGSANSSNSSSWIRAGYSNTSVGQTFMNMDMFGPNLAYATFATSLISRNGNNLGTVKYLHNVATAYTSFTLTTSTGTITGGTIRVYGYANS